MPMDVKTRGRVCHLMSVAPFSMLKSGDSMVCAIVQRARPDAEACTTRHFEFFECIDFFYTRVLKVQFLSFFFSFLFFHGDFIIVLSCVVIMQRYLTDS
jgi:hypothetical protein